MKLCAVSGRPILLHSASPLLDIVALATSACFQETMDVQMIRVRPPPAYIPAPPSQSFQFLFLLGLLGDWVRVHGLGLRASPLLLVGGLANPGRDHMWTMGALGSFDFFCLLQASSLQDVYFLQVAYTINGEIESRSVGYSGQILQWWQRAAEVTSKESLTGQQRLLDECGPEQG